MKQYGKQINRVIKIIISLTLLLMILTNGQACANAREVSAEEVKTDSTSETNAAEENVSTALIDALKELVESLDGESLKEYLDSVEFFDSKGSLFETLKSIIFAENGTDGESTLNYFLQTFLGKIYGLIPILATIMAICVLYAIIKAVSSDYFNQGFGNIVYYVFLSAIIILLGYKLFGLITDCSSCIDNLAKQMNVVFPIILTLMAASGGTVSASVYQPAVAFLSNGITNVIAVAVIPLVTLILVLSFVNGLSEKIKTEKLNDFFSSIVKTIFGISMTVFSIFLTTKGLTSAATDGIYLRATKYAISSAVPLVGGFLRDGFDLILACSVLLKNAVGVCAIIIIIGTLISPIIELIAFMLALKLLSAVSEPLCDGKICGLFSSLSKGLGYLLSSLLVVGFMYFITALLLICSSNVIF